jgi:hypothetical protein
MFVRNVIVWMTFFDQVLREVLASAQIILAFISRPIQLEHRDLDRALAQLDGLFEELTKPVGMPVGERAP